MGENREIKKERCNLPKQEFNDKIYTLYKNERYYSRGTKRLHRIKWEYYNGEIPEGFHIHHINRITTDNRIENLELISKSEHLSEHGKERVKNNPEWFNKFHEKGIKKAKEWHKSDEGRTWHKKHAEDFSFGNQTYGEADCECCGEEFNRKNISQRFCSNKCKSKWRRDSGVDDEQRICEHCGKEFTTNKYTKNRFCGKKCSIRSRYD